MVSPVRYLKMSRWFVFSLSVLLGCLTPGIVSAQRLDWKLEDFKPIIELPWDEEMKMPMEQVIRAIFQEPELVVRLHVLDEYLRAVPNTELGKALELCLEYEGTQNPDELVQYFISLWAKRDPVACWTRVKELLKVVGIEDGWLHYDSWKKGRSRITVQNQEAIQKSKYWLTSQALSGFAAAVEQSSLSRAERTKLLKEFADAWITAFGEMPSEGKSSYAPEASAIPLSYIFSGSPMSRRGYISNDGSCISELAARRYIKAFPAEAPEVIELLSSQKGPKADPSEPDSPAGPSRAFFQLWAEADLAGMTRWVDTQEARKTEDWKERQRTSMAKGILMSRVDADKRKQWLAQARKAKALDELLPAWAQADPKAALDAAMQTKDAEIIEEVVEDAAYGPQRGQPWNTSHPGMGVVRDYDFSVLPGEIHRQAVGDAGIAIMEQWGDLDVGEAARFGIDLILKTDYTPRENLNKLFSGDDEFASDGDMIDRTFCALRVWAVTKPDEMKAWVATLKEEDLRAALTWLLENPWGTGSEE